MKILKIIECDENLTAEQCHNKALEKIESGNLKQAIEFAKKAVEKKPENPIFHNTLGAVLHKTGDLLAALEEYKKALCFKRDYASAYGNIGTVFKEMKQYEAGAKYCKYAIEFDPNLAAAYNGLGLNLQLMSKYTQAMNAYQKAVEIQPDYVEALSNLGGVMAILNMVEKGLECCNKAIEIEPNNAIANNNAGANYSASGQYEKAIKKYEKALQINPNYDEAKYNIGCANLVLGNLEKGWPGYEMRLKKFELTSYIKNQNIPMWDGTDLQGKTLLVHYEQGLGDSIQFVRYLKNLETLAAKVVYYEQKALAGLVGDITEFEVRLCHGEQAPDFSEFDCYIPLMSLARIFNTNIKTIPNEVPYLYADSKKANEWKKKISHDKNFKIAVAWAGSPKHKNDHNRSAKLRYFEPLAKLKNVTLYSLQKGKPVEQIEQLNGKFEVVNLDETIKDFSDTAAIMDNMDMVISVDTAVLHLAGAMGKKVWAVLPKKAEWRWLIDRTDSPWYPTMTLFMQRENGDWQELFERIAEKLGNELAESTS